MALSDTIKNKFSTGYGIEVDWIVLSQDQAAGTSTLEAKLYWCSYGSSYYVNSTAHKTGAISLTTSSGGNTKTFSEPNAGLNGNQRKLLDTYTRTIAHKSDGSLNVDIVGRFDCKVTLNGKYFASVSVSGTANVTDIQSGNGSINVNGSNKTAKAIFVNVNGTWKKVKTTYVNINGTWKKTK